MKRLISAGLLLITTVMLSACSGSSDGSKTMRKEGVAPYELSAGEKQLLQFFCMEDTSQILSFKAPKEAVALHVNVYRLEDGGKWSSIGGGCVSVGADETPAKQLAGTVAMQLKDNYVVDLVVNMDGRASYKTDEILLGCEPMASIKGFLQEYQEITINEEIPVALMVYDSGTSMASHSLQDFFETSRFEGMDFVQAVTLEFSDR